MWKALLLVTLAVLSCHAFPRHHRLRRQAEQAGSTRSCKNTYDQCPQWKGEGMCTSEQYKEYMETVCPVTCEFCKENNHVRDEIEEPEETSMHLLEPSEEEDSDETPATEDSSNEEGAKEESGSGSGTSDEESGSGSNETTSKKDQTEEGDEESGQSEEAKEDDETPEEEDAAKPVQTPKQEKQANKFNKGEISVLLRQSFKNDFTNKDSAPYRMLSGNVVHDFEKALKVKVSDVSFSEGSIDGNPKQTGKTKMTFSVSGSDQKVLKKLTKLVNTDQNINGLSVYAGSLEYDE